MQFHPVITPGDYLYVSKSASLVRSRRICTNASMDNHLELLCSRCRSVSDHSFFFLSPNDAAFSWYSFISHATHAASSVSLIGMPYACMTALSFA